MDYRMNIEGFSVQEAEDVKRCLEMLLSVQEGSQPMDRALGINSEQITGYPLNIARNALVLEITEKVRIYEPRVEVKEINFETKEDGQLKPIIHFIKAEVQ